MPITHEVDETNRVLVTRFTGAVSFADYVEHIEAVKADPRFDPAFRKIAYVETNCTFHLSREDIEQMSKIRILEPSAKRAIVAPKTDAYGLARMYQIFMELDGLDSFRVFRSEPDALAWLNMP